MACHAPAFGSRYGGLFWTSSPLSGLSLYQVRMTIKCCPDSPSSPPCTLYENWEEGDLHFGRVSFAVFIGGLACWGSAAGWASVACWWAVLVPSSSSPLSAPGWGFSGPEGSRGTFPSPPMFFYKITFIFPEPFFSYFYPCKSYITTQGFSLSRQHDCLVAGGQRSTRCHNVIGNLI